MSDAAPMVARCLELQSDTIPAPLEALGTAAESPGTLSWQTHSTYCERCACDHGLPLPDADPILP